MKVLLITATLILSASCGAAASAATGPPRGCRSCRPSDLVELARLDPTIRLDLRYASPENFTGRALYPVGRAFLQRPAAEALVSAHRWLRERGLGLVVFDAYRPWSVTKLFWEMTPAAKRAFVADPATGSAHNRGCAVDVGLYELATGRAVEMPSAFEEATERSSMSYRGGTDEQRGMRDLLRTAMEREGMFKVFRREWWHYTFKDYTRYPVLDVPLSEIAASK